MKYCNSCKTEKPLSEFGMRSDKFKHRPRSHCRVCEAAYSRDNRPSREQKRAYDLKFKYGLSMAEYELMAADGCQVCSSKDNLHVDHDHASGDVRGVLCHGCNTSLGLLDEDTARMLALIEYTNRTKATA